MTVTVKKASSFVKQMDSVIMANEGYIVLLPLLNACEKFVLS